MDQKRGFKLKRTAMKFSANIIWLLLYLFVESPCLRGTPVAGRRKRCGVNTAVSRRPYKVMWELFVLSGCAQTKQLFFVKVLLVLFFQEKDGKTLMLQNRMPRGERPRCERARRQETRRARAWHPAEALPICRCSPPWKMPQNSSWKNSETAPP